MPEILSEAKAGTAATDQPAAEGVVQDPAVTGKGEITLDLGERTTLTTRILRCKLDTAGHLSRLELDFETRPGDRVDLVMTREDGSALSTEAKLSNGVVLNSQENGHTDWRLDVQNGHITARGSVGEGGEAVAFTLTGECPAD